MQKGVRGLRNVGGAAMGMAMAARGTFDAFYEDGNQKTLATVTKHFCKHLLRNFVFAFYILQVSGGRGTSLRAPYKNTKIKKHEKVNRNVLKNVKSFL